MKLFKKVLSVAAVLAFVVTALPARAFAATDVVDFEDGNVPSSLSMKIDDGGDNSLLSVVDFNGSKQLFIDIQEEKGPKMIIDVIALVGGDNIDKIRKVDLDVTFVKPDSTLATQWVGGRIGANYGPDGSTWYEDSTKDYSGGNYDDAAANANVCGPIKASLPFLDGFGFTNNAEGSKFLFMAWPNDKTLDLYIDNITFYDADGNKIALAAAEAPAEEAAATDDAAATDVPKTGVVGLGIVYGLSALATGAFALKRKQR